MVIKEKSDIDVVTDLTREAWCLRGELELLIVHPERRVEGRTIHVPGPRIPWHTRAANGIMDLAVLSRELEHDLEQQLGIGSGRKRGPSDGNTRLALEHIPRLLSGIRDHSVTAWATSLLDRWIVRAKIALGEVEPLERLPRHEGMSEPSCPWCHAHTLRFQRGAGVVRCVNPSCRDENGSRPRALIEVGSLSGEPMLVWQTGETGIDVDQIVA